jgi:hypothetical protein
MEKLLIIGYFVILFLNPHGSLIRITENHTTMDDNSSLFQDLPALCPDPIWQSLKLNPLNIDPIQESGTQIAKPRKQVI